MKALSQINGSRTKSLKRKKGCRFEFCYGGHDFNCREGKLLITDELDVKVMFEKDDDGDHYGYMVDFTDRKLEEYHTYPFHEYFEFFC